MVSTSTASRADGTTTTTAVPGSANDTTGVVPKAVPEATITTPSLHLPSTTSILIDSEMTTGNSNLSQHCKRMRFLSFSSITAPHALVADLTQCLNCRGVSAGTPWCTAGDISSSLCRHLGCDGCSNSITWCVKELVSAFTQGT